MYDKHHAALTSSQHSRLALSKAPEIRPWRKWSLDEEGVADEFPSNTEPLTICQHMHNLPSLARLGTAAPGVVVCGTQMGKVRIHAAL
jgi:hypothetical protein